MSRQIKFRAWDKLHSKMLYFEKEHPASLCMAGGGVVGHCLLNGETVVFVLDELEPLQFTGLRQNEREIYEGDCFKLPLCWPVFIVVWDEQYAQFMLKGEHEAGHGRPLYDWLDRAEYVGNIYENPELIEAP